MAVSPSHKTERGDSCMPVSGSQRRADAAQRCCVSVMRTGQGAMGLWITRTHARVIAADHCSGAR
jgi:hypothetical protein